MDTVIDATAVVAPYKVDTSRGTLRGDVSAQWFTRAADQRYLSLDTLFEAVARRRDTSFEEVAGAGLVQFRGSEEDPLALSALLPSGQVLSPTHYAFGQMCQLAKMGRATDIFRSQPGWLAGLNLTYGLSRNVRENSVKLYGDHERQELRAATGPDYGRIFDADLVEMVRKVTGNGTGDTRWKVPGIMNWANSTYNPYVDVTTETTTLFASDRDVFLFLVDDTHPIEIGKLANGDPDLVFRGFYAQNSEVGSKSLKIATFWLRAVCQNRNLWGTEDFQELTIIHSKHGMGRFAREAERTLTTYAESQPTKLLAGIAAAKEAVVAKDDEDRVKFLTADSLGFSLKRAQAIVAQHEREEGHPPETVWDMVQGMTAFARTIPNQDNRIEVERLAARVMDRAARHAMA